MHFMRALTWKSLSPLEKKLICHLPWLKVKLGNASDDHEKEKEKEKNIYALKESYSCEEGVNEI